jgi:hypothetical protein
LVATTAFGTIGYGIGKGYQAIFGTTDKQEQALDRWVAPYEVGDKNFYLNKKILKQVKGNTIIKTGVITTLMII